MVHTNKNKVLELSTDDRSADWIKYVTNEDGKFVLKPPEQNRTLLEELKSLLNTVKGSQ